MSGEVVIKRGMRVVWKPEWRAKGDDKYTFIAVTDEHPVDRGFYASTIENTMFFRPQSPGRADMVESAEPYLPVATLTFMGLAKKGARVQLRRTLGDRELSLTALRASQVSGAFYFCYEPGGSGTADVPRIDEITVDDAAQTIAITATGYADVYWIGPGTTLVGTAATFDFSAYFDEPFVRAILFGASGNCYTQPFGFETTDDP